MRVVVMGRPVSPPVSLMLVFDYLDDVINSVGESDVLVVASVMATPPRARSPSAIFEYH